MVYTMEGSEEYVTLDGRVYHSGTRREIETKDGIITVRGLQWDKVHLTPQLDVYYEFEDLGNILRLRYYKAGDQEKDWTQSENPMTLRLCGDMPITSWLILPFRRPFRWLGADAAVDTSAFR